MAEVHIVFRSYHEHTDKIEDLYNEDVIEKVFENEDEAIVYIYEKIKDDHICVDATYTEGENIIKHQPSLYRIQNHSIVESWERCDDDIYILKSYRYETYNVE